MAEFEAVEEQGPEFEVHECMKKPIKIQSAKATPDNMHQVLDWITGHGHAATLGVDQLIIQTLEGPFTVRPGDYVLRGVRGEFYRCDAEIYEESYDDYGPVAEEAQA